MTVPSYITLSIMATAAIFFRRPPEFTSLIYAMINDPSIHHEKNAFMKIINPEQFTATQVLSSANCGLLLPYCVIHKLTH
jgi:hypothetical protein